MNHKQGFALVACVGSVANMSSIGYSQEMERTASGFGRLISGLGGTGGPSVPKFIGAVGRKSMIDGSGVVSLKESMYFVSAISNFSRISSRSSIIFAS